MFNLKVTLCLKAAPKIQVCLLPTEKGVDLFQE